MIYTGSMSRDRLFYVIQILLFPNTFTFHPDSETDLEQGWEGGVLNENLHGNKILMCPYSSIKTCNTKKALVVKTLVC